MIVRERKDAFVMIEQHHHGALAGQLYAQLNETLLPSIAWRKAISYAIIHHDCGWIHFDQEPLWDDEKSVPYSFNHLPIGPKIVLYTFGINQVEENSPYAALLCSMHYVSFLRKRKDNLSIQFVHKEQLRQKSIMSTLHISDETMVHRHYQLLKFFDDLSLYICLNEPGTESKNIHPFFKNGLNAPSSFHMGKIHPVWKLNGRIAFEENIFMNDFTLQLKQKVLSKKAIEKIGIKKAYHEADIEMVPIKISSGEYEDKNEEKDK